MGVLFGVYRGQDNPGKWQSHEDIYCIVQVCSLNARCCHASNRDTSQVSPNMHSALFGAACQLHLRTLVATTYLGATAVGYMFVLSLSQKEES